MIHYEQLENGSACNWYADDPILQRYAKRYLAEAVLREVEPSFVRTGALAAGPMERRAIHTDREGAPRPYL